MNSSRHGVLGGRFRQREQFDFSGTALFIDVPTMRLSDFSGYVPPRELFTFNKPGYGSTGEAGLCQLSSGRAISRIHRSRSLWYFVGFRLMLPAGLEPARPCSAC